MRRDWKITDRVRETFDGGAGNIVAYHDHDGRRVIAVEYGCDRGDFWCSYPGGPLHGDLAVNAVERERDHIEKYRDLLPGGWQNAEIIVRRFS